MEEAVLAGDIRKKWEQGDWLPDTCSPQEGCALNCGSLLLTASPTRPSTPLKSSSVLDKCRGERELGNPGHTCCDSTRNMDAKRPRNGK